MLSCCSPNPIVSAQAQVSLVASPLCFAWPVHMSDSTSHHRMRSRSPLFRDARARAAHCVHVCEIAAENAEESAARARLKAEEVTAAAREAARQASAAVRAASSAADQAVAAWEACTEAMSHARDAGDAMRSAQQSAERLLAELR